MQRCQLLLFLSIKARRSHLEESNAVGRASQISLDCSPVGLTLVSLLALALRGGRGASVPNVSAGRGVLRSVLSSEVLPFLRQGKQEQMLSMAQGGITLDPVTFVT
jgi:hypothetical protein